MVISWDKAEFDPRYPSLKGIMAAKKKTRLKKFHLLTWELKIQQATKFLHIFCPKKKQGASILEGETNGIADQLIDIFKNTIKVL